MIDGRAWGLVLALSMPASASAQFGLSDLMDACVVAAAEGAPNAVEPLASDSQRFGSDFYGLVETSYGAVVVSVHGPADPGTWPPSNETCSIIGIDKSLSVSVPWSAVQGELERWIGKAEHSGGNYSDLLCVPPGIVVRVDAGPDRGEYFAAQEPPDRSEPEALRFMAERIPEQECDVTSRLSIASAREAA